MPALQPRGVYMVISQNQSRERTSEGVVQPVCVTEKKTEALPSRTATEPGGPRASDSPRSVSHTHTYTAGLRLPRLQKATEQRGEPPPSLRAPLQTASWQFFLHFLLPHPTLPEPTTDTSQRVDSLYGFFTFADKITKPRELCLIVLLVCWLEKRHHRP